MRENFALKSEQDASNYLVFYKMAENIYERSFVADALCWYSPKYWIR